MRSSLIFLFLGLLNLPLLAQETNSPALQPVVETQLPADKPDEATPPPVSTPLEPAPLSAPPPAPSVPVPLKPAIPPEKKPAAPRVTPQIFGDRTGPVYIGLRTVLDRRTGWGWIKAEDDDWMRAKWAIIQETPGVVKAPGRFLSNPKGDQLMTYKLYGEFASYTGYEPDFDVFVPVFKLKGFEIIGPGEALKREPPHASGGGADSSAFSRKPGHAR